MKDQILTPKAMIGINLLVDTSNSWLYTNPMPSIKIICCIEIQNGPSTVRL
jgi:hypothetical protein